MIQGVKCSFCLTQAVYLSKWSQCYHHNLSLNVSMSPRSSLTFLMQSCTAFTASIWLTFESGLKDKWNWIASAEADSWEIHLDYLKDFACIHTVYHEQGMNPGEHHHIDLIFLRSSLWKRQVTIYGLDTMQSSAVYVRLHVGVFLFMIYLLSK